MKNFTKIPKKKLYIILITAGVLILALSLEMLIRVKDYTYFQEWLIDIRENQDAYLSKTDAFNAYLSMNLGYYFISLVVPVIFSLHCYFSYTRLQVNALFIFLWTVLLVGGLGYTFLEYNYYSPFYYVRLISYIVLIFTNLSLSKNLSKSKFL